MHARTADQPQVPQPRPQQAVQTVGLTERSAPHIRSPPDLKRQPAGRVDRADHLCSAAPQLF